MTGTERTLTAEDLISPVPENIIQAIAEHCVFPVTIDNAKTHGMTKRELFAAMAMQGICGDGIPGSHHQPEDTARDAVAYADALLKELAK